MRTTLDPQLDTARLTTLLHRVSAALDNGGWWTLGELYIRCGGSEAGISARLRQLRSQGQTIDRRRRGDPKRGVWEYRRATA